MARAAGIPSRLEMGFVYTGGVWGGHAWVEVFDRGEWIPIDAARISFYSSSLEEGSLTGTGALAQLYGNVEIDILSYRLDGKTIEVGANAQAYSVTGNHYDNPWLGIHIHKAPDYRFTNLDRTWPEAGLLSIRGPAGEITLDSFDGALPKDKAALLLPNDGETWLLTAEGPDPAALLRKASEWLSFPLRK